MQPACFAGTIAQGPFVSYDSDALAYITAVETADGQSLETGVKTAINTFVVGCKADSIWTPLKACCILAGARTLTGALVPLKGTAPTNVNFVSGDYNRETGLVGNGSTKYLNSNRANNADGQNNQHISCYISTASTGNCLAADGAAQSASQVRGDGASRSRHAAQDAGSGTPLGLLGISRSGSANYSRRINGTTSTVTRTSEVLISSANIFVFANNTSGPSAYGTPRLAFYSIGMALTLATLDSRVTTLISDIAAAIP